MIVAIWNDHKLASYYQGDKPCDTYEALIEYEESTGSSLSSNIEVNDELHLKQILEAIYNETDCELCSHVLEP